MHGPRLLLIVAIIIVLVVGGSFAYAHYRYGMPDQGSSPQACTAEAKICPDGTAVGRTGPNCSFAACPPVATTTPDSSALQATTTATSTNATKSPAKDPAKPISFSGKVIAGSLSASPLFDFNNVDYDAAMRSGKLIVLFFYTNWDQYSQVEFEAMESAFDSLPAGAIGFRVEYNDSTMSADEIMLARSLSVGIVRTKLLEKGGAVLLKTADPWTLNDFATEIKARISS
jgi:hypothetical protein